MQQARPTLLSHIGLMNRYNAQTPLTGASTASIPFLTVSMTVLWHGCSRTDMKQLLMQRFNLVARYVERLLTHGYDTRL